MRPSLDRHTARGQERTGSRWAAPPSRRARAVFTCVARGFRAHPGGPPERDPTSMRAVIVRRRLVIEVPWGRCVGPVDRGRSPRLGRGRRTVGPGARQGDRAGRRGRASRSCRLATRDRTAAPPRHRPVRPPTSPRLPGSVRPCVLRTAGGVRRRTGRPRPRPSGGGRVTPPRRGATPDR